MPWLKANYPEGNYSGSKNGTLAHMSVRDPKFSRENMAAFWENNFWPPASPDFNALDIFWLGVIERDTNATPHPNLDSISVAIAKMWADFPEESVRKVCAAVRPRIEVVVANRGRHTEQKSFPIPFSLTFVEDVSL